MFASMSFASVVVVLIVAFYCRKTLFVIGDKIPSSVEKAVVHLDDIVTTNVLENEAELKVRTKDAYEALKALGDINISDMYAELHPTKKNRPTTVTA